MSDRLPNPDLRCVLAEEEVLILSDTEIKTKSIDQLKIALGYYTTVLETLAGTQVWDIIDSKKSVESQLKKIKG